MSDPQDDKTALETDLCHANGGQGDCYWPDWRPHAGVDGLPMPKPPMYFTCAERITNPTLEFPCTGSKHVGAQVIVCSCDCHSRLPNVVGQLIPADSARPLDWRVF